MSDNFNDIFMNNNNVSNNIKSKSKSKIKSKLKSKSNNKNVYLEDLFNDDLNSVFKKNNNSGNNSSKGNNYSNSNYNYNNNSNNNSFDTKNKYMLSMIILVYFLSKICFYALSKLFSLPVHIKQFNQEMIDFTITIVLTIITLILTNTDHIDYNMIIGLILGVMSTFFISYIKHKFKSPKWYDVFILITLSVFALYVVVTNVANIDPFMNKFKYVLFLIGVILIISLLLLTKHNRYNVVVDPGLFAWIFSLFFFNSRNFTSINVIKGLFIGIYISSISLYGIDFILEPSNKIKESKCPITLSGNDREAILNELANVKNGLNQYKTLYYLFAFIIIVITSYLYKFSNK
jgi:hypothetical protein